MLELIRRNRRLGRWVLALCAMLWLVAMLAGVRVRVMPWPEAAATTPEAAMELAVQHDICTVMDDAAQPLGLVDGQATPNTPAAAPSPGAHAGAHGDAPASSHSHQDPDCLLCIALSPPATVALQVYKPPRPVHGPVWLAPAYFPPALQAAAPLPPRGPPARFHA
ncbi:hypothetical protein [Comamonas sp. GB3 AK4-5]|uniref:hypothetical protein n=1 Tax=Comamonas sp. GB3 AK4-5 TaxID=3231487 RepID=UPI00351F4EC9